MSDFRATPQQYIEARRPLFSVKSFSDKYVAHLLKVWNEADGLGKKALLARTNEALTERFGPIEGGKKFVAAMEGVK